MRSKFRVLAVALLAVGLSVTSLYGLGNGKDEVQNWDCKGSHIAMENAHSRVAQNNNSDCSHESNCSSSVCVSMGSCATVVFVLASNNEFIINTILLSGKYELLKKSYFSQNTPPIIPPPLSRVLIA
jgi:hypothetical protein